QRADTGMKSGILVGGQLRLPALDKSSETALAREVAQTIGKPDSTEGSFRVAINGTPHLLLSKPLNLHSTYPPAYQVCIYPLTRLLAREQQLRWQILGA